MKIPSVEGQERGPAEDVQVCRALKIVKNRIRGRGERGNRCPSNLSWTMLEKLWVLNDESFSMEVPNGYLRDLLVQSLKAQIMNQLWVIYFHCHFLSVKVVISDPFGLSFPQLERQLDVIIQLSLNDLMRGFCVRSPSMRWSIILPIDAFLQSTRSLVMELTRKRLSVNQSFDKNPNFLSKTLTQAGFKKSTIFHFRTPLGFFGFSFEIFALKFFDFENFLVMKWQYPTGEFCSDHFRNPLSTVS